MGCGCGKSFSSGSYATGQRYRAGTTGHVPQQRTPPVSIQSKSLQARNGTVPQQQPAVQASSGRRKV